MLSLSLGIDHSESLVGFHDGLSVLIFEDVAILIFLRSHLTRALVDAERAADAVHRRDLDAELESLDIRST